MGMQYAEVAGLSMPVSRLVQGITSSVPCATETLAESVAGVAHICFEGLESESLLFLLDEQGVCVSAASACASGAMEPSHVLAAMGVEPTLSVGALRLSMGHTTTPDDVRRAQEAGFQRFNVETLGLSTTAIPTLQVVDDTYTAHRDVMAQVIARAKQRAGIG